ncbi:hypothetical protein [Rhizobacter sp. OV335]|uniref:hypothetical protein n=1 Tax=Rhizobacter sp. OV335 TaxID=1500264 RepID=UPI00091E4D74|nr:hypothetical protein [Rhizobacter sp. OV335]SHM39248.1 hypothetical protein SAMN02787076_01191 [Rhizobacter sp. OV335]
MIGRTSTLRDSAGKFESRVMGPYTPASVEICGELHELDKLVSRYEAETRARPTYRIKPIESPDTWAVMTMVEDVGKEVGSVMSSYAGNLLGDVLRTKGESRQRLDLLWHFVGSGVPIERIAARGAAKSCASISAVTFEAMIDRLKRPGAPRCKRVDLVASTSLDHAWLSIVMPDDTQVIYDFWTGRQAFMLDDGRFAAAQDATICKSWTPGQEIPMPWQSFKSEATDAGLPRPEELRVPFPGSWPYESDSLRGLESPIPVNAPIQELRTETDCLLTGPQREDAGLAPDELIAYQGPDGSIFSNDVVPEASLQPKWVRAEVKLYGAQGEWEARLSEACEAGDTALVAELLSSPAVRAKFAKRHEEWSCRALLSTLNRSPLDEPMVQVLLAGAVDAEASSRLQREVDAWQSFQAIAQVNQAVMLWALSMQLRVGEGSVPSLRQLLTSQGSAAAFNACPREVATSALCYLITMGQMTKEALETLIELGADPHWATLEGSPLDLATRLGKEPGEHHAIRQEISQLLQAAAESVNQ